MSTDMADQFRSYVQSVVDLLRLTYADAGHGKWHGAKGYVEAANTHRGTAHIYLANSVLVGSHHDIEQIRTAMMFLRTEVETVRKSVAMQAERAVAHSVGMATETCGVLLDYVPMVEWHELPLGADYE